MAVPSELKAEGNTAFSKQEYLKAAALYSKAIKAGSDDYVLHSNLAAALLKLGKVQKALTSAEECVRLNDSFAKGWFRQGSALEALDRRAEALKCYEKALELDPGNREIEQKARLVSKALTRQSQSKASTERKAAAAAASRKGESKGG